MRTLLRNNPARVAHIHARGTRCTEGRWRDDAGIVLTIARSPLLRTICHLIGAYPSRTGYVLFDPLPAQLFHQIRDAYPQHSDWQRVLPGLVVNRDLDFVCLVDINVVALVQPLVVAGGFCPDPGYIFNLDDHKRFRAAGEPGGARMIDIHYCQHTDLQPAGQGATNVWGIYAVVCERESTREAEATKDGRKPTISFVDVHNDV